MIGGDWHPNPERWPDAACAINHERHRTARLLSGEGVMRPRLRRHALTVTDPHFVGNGQGPVGKDIVVVCGVFEVPLEPVGQPAARTTEIEETVSAYCWTERFEELAGAGQTGTPDTSI